MTQTTISGFLLALAVVFGAFGAHGLKDILDPYSMSVYQTGVSYHFYHGLGMLAIPLLVNAGLVTAGAGKWAHRLMGIGILFFSGSLYVLALSGQTILGAVAPIGGTAFIAGWMMLAWGSLHAKAPMQLGVTRLAIDCSCADNETTFACRCRQSQQTLQRHLHRNRPPDDGPRGMDRARPDSKPCVRSRIRSP